MKAESIIDGTVDIAYLGLLNDAITVIDENKRRLRPRGDDH